MPIKSRHRPEDESLPVKPGHGSITMRKRSKGVKFAGNRGRPRPVRFMAYGEEDVRTFPTAVSMKLRGRNAYSREDLGYRR